MKKMTKWLSMLLIVTMVVTVFAGCAKGTTQKSTSSGSEKKTESMTGTKQEESKTEEKEEPTVITFASTRALTKDPIPWYEMDVWKKVWEEANIKIEYIEYDDDLFNLMLTSGDVPDIVFSTNGSKVDDIVKSGLALDLEPYIEEYAPNMNLEVYQSRNALVKELKGGENNGLYFIAPRIGVENARGGTDSSRSYNIRWDYYKELGCPEITSDDDYIDIMEQMVKNHPTNEKGEKTYAMGLDDRLDRWYRRAAFVKPVLANMWTFSGSQYMASYVDGHLVNGYTEIEASAYWTDMKFYNKLYNKGLLDPDSFTQTGSEFADKINAGRYMATPSKENSFYITASKENPETLAGFVRVPSANAIVFCDKKMLLGDFPGCYLFVGAKTENLEAVMRFLNVLHDLDTQRMLASGIEGVHWNYVDGVPTFTDEMKALITSNSEQLRVIGANLGNKVTVGFETVQPSFEHPDGYPVNLNDSDEVRAETDTFIMQDVAKYYDAPYGAKACYRLVEEGKTIDASNDAGQLIASAMPAQPTDISRGLEKLNDILYRAIPELVMAKDDAEFKAIQDRVLKDLADAGEAEVWEWCSTEYNKARERILPIFESVNW